MVVVLLLLEEITLHLHTQSAKIIWAPNYHAVDRVIRGSQSPEVKYGSGSAWLGSARLTTERESESYTPVSLGTRGRDRRGKKRWVESGAVNRNSLNINQSRLQTARLSKHGRWCRGEPKQSIRGGRQEEHVSPTNIWIKYITVAPRKLIGPSSFLPPTTPASVEHWLRPSSPP